MNAKGLGINSKLVHGGYHPDGTGAVNVPIYQSSPFAFRDAAHGATLFAGTEKGYIYARIGADLSQDRRVKAVATAKFLEAR